METVITIPQPDQALFDQAQLALSDSRGSSIATAGDYEGAGKSLIAIKGMQKQLEEKRTAITKPLNDALKAVNDLFRPAKTWLEEAEKIHKDQMVAYREAEAAKAREQQRLLDEAARKEREALAAKAAEAERKAKEKADALRAAAKNEEERRAAELKAQRAEAAAAAKAEEMRAQAAQVVAPKVIAPDTKSVGQSVRETWNFELADLSLVPREYLMLDEKKVRAVVQALKGTTNIPGIRVTRGEVIASQARF